ncbi:MAG TPA: amidohydrolase, partial [Armatimonadota bacterium]|nr:amidohydrolase [Armatimonadota bacterium]
MKEQYSRREFLLRGACGAAALAAVDPLREALAADRLPTIPIIDPHQHLWDLRRFRLLWLPEQPSLNHSHLLKDYRAATAGLNIEKTVYMEVDLDPKQQVQEAEYVL